MSRKVRRNIALITLSNLKFQEQQKIYPIHSPWPSYFFSFPVILESIATIEGPKFRKHYLHSGRSEGGTLAALTIYLVIMEKGTLLRNILTNIHPKI